MLAPNYLTVTRKYLSCKYLNKIIIIIIIIQATRLQTSVTHTRKLKTIVKVSTDYGDSFYNFLPTVIALA